MWHVGDPPGSVTSRCVQTRGPILAQDTAHQGAVMHAVNCRVARLLFVLTLLPLPVFAQDWSQPWADPMDRPARVDVTGSMGFVMPSNWSKLVLLGSISSGSGVFEQ